MFSTLLRLSFANKNFLLTYLLFPHPLSLFLEHWLLRLQITNRFFQLHHLVFGIYSPMHFINISLINLFLFHHMLLQDIFSPLNAFLLFHSTCNYLFNKSSIRIHCWYPTELFSHFTVFCRTLQLHSKVRLLSWYVCLSVRRLWRKCIVTKLLTIGSCGFSLDFFAADTGQRGEI